MSQKQIHLTILLLMVAMIATGCATKKQMRTYVSGETQVLNSRIDDVETQVETTQTELGTRIDTQDRKLEETSVTAREALERAVAAGKLAEGKLLYETVLTDQDVRFGFDKSQLSDEAKAALDTFANDLKASYQNVYIEIQGHTDATGSESYNYDLGEARAEAARRYLNMEHDLPLHRMSVISYGEAAPLADNKSRDGRAQNRRVAMVVLM